MTTHNQWLMASGWPTDAYFSMANYEQWLINGWWPFVNNHWWMALDRSIVDHSPVANDWWSQPSIIDECSPVTDHWRCIIDHLWKIDSHWSITDHHSLAIGEGTSAIDQSLTISHWSLMKDPQAVVTGQIFGHWWKTRSNWQTTDHSLIIEGSSAIYQSMISHWSSVNDRQSLTNQWSSFIGHWRRNICHWSIIDHSSFIIDEGYPGNGHWSNRWPLKDPLPLTNHWSFIDYWWIISHWTINDQSLIIGEGQPVIDQSIIKHILWGIGHWWMSMGHWSITGHQTYHWSFIDYWWIISHWTINDQSLIICEGPPVIDQ